MRGRIRTFQHESEAGSGGLDARDGGQRGKFRLSAFSALKIRDYRWFWFGMLASFNGMQMQMVARGWLVYTMTDSAFLLGLVSAGYGIPMVVLSLYGGAVVDRVRKRNLLVTVRGGLSILSLIITVLILINKISVWHLFANSVLSGVLFSFYGPGRQAFIAELVGKDSIMNAIAMNSMAMNICRVASPALAGFLIRYIGIPGVYVLVTISGFLVVFSLAMIPAGKKTEVRPGTPLLADVLEGIWYVKDNKVILCLLIIGFIPVLTAMPYQMLMPVFAKTVFAAGETGLGLLMSAVGVGALAGSTTLASLGNYEHKGKLMLVIGSLFGLALALFGLMRTLHPALAVLLSVGFCSTLFMTLVNTLLMTSTPEELLGRVMSIHMMTFGLMPLGTLPAGILAQAVGAPVTVMLGGLLTILFVLVMAFTQPRLRELA
ncbi:MAG: MFS transporter [Deltaproteobacteria bacterium]|nr:MFS transporter [Deltaproteobacteria bacterium]